MDDAKALAKHLRLLSASGFSAATADTINRIAHAAHREQFRSLERNFTIRNKFTAGSLMMFKATARADADKIDALVGSKSPYLDDQEAGGVAPTRDGRALKTMPSRKSRRGDWGKAQASFFRWSTIGKLGVPNGGKIRPNSAKYFMLKPGTGPGRKSRASMHKITGPIIFTRGSGKRLIRVKIVTKHGKIRVRPTHWHTEAMAKYAKPTIMAAAYKIEIEKQLVKLGAK